LDAILNHQDQLFPKKVMARLTNAGKSSNEILQKLNVEHELNSIIKLTDPENESVIANALDKVCKYTSSHFVEECHFMICKYYDVLIEALVSEFGNPDKVCSEFLSLCP